jgi:hypothetical protein
VHWPERMDLWAQWEEIYNDWENPQREQHAEAYYVQHCATLHGGAEVLWPEDERWPLLRAGLSVQVLEIALPERLGSGGVAGLKLANPVSNRSFRRHAGTSHRYSTRDPHRKASECLEPDCE